MSRKASWSTSPERWQTSYWSWPATVSISNKASQSTTSAVLRTSTFAFSTGVICFHYPSCSGVPVEAAVGELMEVTLEEVFNEEGNITSISGVLSSPLVSTSVPTSTSISSSRKASLSSPSTSEGWQSSWWTRPASSVARFLRTGPWRLCSSLSDLR